MFDPIGAFTKQFVPFDGGYLFYPSRTSGGKLVTAAEFDRLVADWTRIAGRRGRWTSVGIIVLAITLWTVVSRSLELPEWSDQLLIYGIVVALSARLLWASHAPRRLVRNRDAIVPPRTASQARREARGLLTWPFVIFAALLSVAIFFSALNKPDRALSSWAWLFGSGLMFGAYLRIGIQKLRDRQR